MPSTRHWAPSLLLLLLLVGWVPRAAAAERSEEEVIAAYLYNFAKFVSWPATKNAGGPLQICVLGASPFGGELDRAVGGKQVNGRELRVTLARSLAEAERCEIVFISTSERGRLDQVLGHFAKRPVLTVSKIAAFAERGGMIGLQTDNQRVRFDVNVTAARDAELKMSSQLLKVARQLIGPASDGSR